MASIHPVGRGILNKRALKKVFSLDSRLVLYVCGQSLNLVLTLIMAYVMSGILFKEVDQ